MQGPAGEAVYAAGIANPIPYALVHKDGTIDADRSFGVDQSDISRPIDHDGYFFVDYCFSGPRPKGIQVTVEREKTLNGPRPPSADVWHSIGHQEDPPAPLSYPVLVTGLGPGENCLEGTEFYVKGFNSTDGAKGYAAFFLTLVL